MALISILRILFRFQVNIFNTTTTNSPKADGLNAMQSWVICCIFFVFGALFEYAIILLQMKVTGTKLTHYAKAMSNVNWGCLT